MCLDFETDKNTYLLYLVASAANNTEVNILWFGMKDNRCNANHFCRSYTFI